MMTQRLLNAPLEGNLMETIAHVIPMEIWWRYYIHQTNEIDIQDVFQFKPNVKYIKKGLCGISK